MPTIEVVRKWASDFERVYPEELPDRLRWFVTDLGVSQSHLLRLMGVPRDEVERLADVSVDWPRAVQQFGEGAAWWAESSIRQILVSYLYDWRALKERLSQPLDKEYEVAEPGGRTTALGSLPPDRREDILLSHITLGGPQTSLALIAYLSQPERVPAGK
jgi:hypothetical protein